MIKAIVKENNDIVLSGDLSEVTAVLMHYITTHEKIDFGWLRQPCPIAFVADAVDQIRASGAVVLRIDVGGFISSLESVADLWPFQIDRVGFRRLHHFGEPLSL